MCIDCVYTGKMGAFPPLGARRKLRAPSWAAKNPGAESSAGHFSWVWRKKYERLAPVFVDQEYVICFVFFTVQFCFLSRFVGISSY